MAGEGAGKSAGGIRGAGGVLARVLLLIPRKPPSQHPCRRSLWRNGFPHRSSQHPPQPFSGFPRFSLLCSRSAGFVGLGSNDVPFPALAFAFGFALTF